MSYVKVIPCLDTNKGRVVKGTKFVNLRDAGDPVEIAERYNSEGADELVFLDITATNEDRNTTVELAKKTAEKVSMPFTVGGGIRTLEDIQKILDAGADKVSLNSAAVKNPEIIKQASGKFGSGRIVSAIDVKKISAGKWSVLINGGQTDTGVDAVEWAKKAESLGAGEILLTSMDRDGTKDGYDNELLKAVTDAVKIPVTASGGAGKLEHFYEACINGASAVLAASLFHFREITVKEVKDYLKSKNIPVR
ncbi:MAG: imidazole glycerol phosphate synthase subunit HisF [Endomicrobium sp.]|jgi:cyclase|nr:imidazole glycerol phosphate synthase subunit HisF [Endomicrobium sp.]